MIPSTSSRTLAIRWEYLPKCAASGPKPGKCHYEQHTERNHRQKILDICNDKYINKLNNLTITIHNLQNSHMVKFPSLFLINKPIKEIFKNSDLYLFMDFGVSAIIPL